MSKLTVDADFPGGNAIYEGITGDTVHVRQDLRDTTVWWFYWCFRARNAAGRSLRFEFANGNVFGPAGPCCSHNGVDWHWLGQDCVNGDSFSYTFTLDQCETYFAFCPMYTESNLQSFLCGHQYVQQEVLAASEDGRSIEVLSIPAEDAKSSLLITARHHSCETVADYVIEGFLEEWENGGDQSDFLRMHVDLYAVPFVDKDGVESGDQGKMRAPHDHWQDYTDTPVYASVRGIQDLCQEFRAPLGLALDLHCPWIRGEHAESVLLLDPEPNWQGAVDYFWSSLIRNGRNAVSQTPLTRIPYGTSFNVDSNDCATYLRRHCNALAMTIEFPYALAVDVLITPDEARLFGADLVRAAVDYLRVMI